MINIKYRTNDFMKEMNSIVNYANGFMEGAQAGKRELLETIGERTTEILNQFIDSNARANDAVLHHVYEWYQSGSPSARLFDLEYTTSGGGLTFRSTFRQSSSVQSGSSVPFYDKARIMEQGIPVRIKPVRAEVLTFEDNGQQVFTKSPVTVSNPGGQSVAGGFQQTIDSFFNSYWKQSFLQASGIADILRNPIQFKQNLPRAKAGGRAVGYDVGYRWIAAREAR
jgi:hypothetical protein